MRSVIVAAVALTLPLPLPAAADPGRDTWEVSGYAMSRLAWSQTVFPPGERYTAHLSRLRLALRGRPWPGVVVDLQYDNELLLGSYLDTRQFGLQRDLPPTTYWRASDTYIDGRDGYGEHRLHRASVTWSGDDVDLRIGRQRIAWGTGRFFSALDRFNPFSPTSLERAERPGVDAVLAEFRPGALSNASAVFVPQRSPGSSVGALRWHDNAGAADYSLMIGQFAGASVAESVVGADLATQVGDAGLRAELAIVRAAGRIRSRVLVGMDRAIGDKVTVGAEIYRDGSGAARRKDYDYVALFAGRVQTLARHYLGVFGDVEITPLVKLTVDLIANLDDGSHVISPSLSWSLRPDIDLSFGAQRFAGRNGSEYGSFNDLMFVRLQWHF